MGKKSWRLDYTGGSHCRVLHVQLQGEQMAWENRDGNGIMQAAVFLEFSSSKVNS